MELNRFHRQLLNAVGRGADVFDRRAAVTIRKCAAHGLVTITEAMGDYDPCDRYPYFGAILTAKGRAAVQGGRP